MTQATDTREGPMKIMVAYGVDQDGDVALSVDAENANPLDMFEASHALFLAAVRAIFRTGGGPTFPDEFLLLMLPEDIRKGAAALHQAVVTAHKTAASGDAKAVEGEGSE